MNIEFDVTKAIAERHSVRTYDTHQKVEAELCEKIMAFAATIDNPLGINNIKLALAHKSGLSGQKLGTYGITRGAVTFLGLGVPDDYDAYLAGGYEFETLILYATSLGLGTVWLGETITRTAFASAFGFKKKLKLPVISPIGYAAPQRFMERVIRSISKGDIRREWSTMFFENNIGSAITEKEAGQYASALANVRLAPSSYNDQPWRILKIGNHFHFYADFNDKLTGMPRKHKYIDMGIALCHFCLTLAQAGIKGDVLKRDPGISIPMNYHYICSWHLNDQ